MICCSRQTDALRCVVRPRTVAPASHYDPVATECPQYRLAAAAQIMEGAVGSLTHAAPELLDSRGNTTQSDIYAFGVLMYEVISGKEPFKDCAVHDLIQAKTTTPTVELLPMEPGDDPIYAAFVKVGTRTASAPLPCMCAVLQLRGLPQPQRWHQ